MHISFVNFFLGNAVRYCDGNKVWSSTDALSCASVELVNLLEEVMLVAKNKNIVTVKPTVSVRYKQTTNIMPCYLH